MNTRIFCWNLIFCFLYTIEAKAQPTADGIAFESLGDWDSIRHLAKARNLPIFVDVHAEWCVPCKQMDKKVFAKKEVGGFFNQHFVSVEAKSDTELGRQLMSEHLVYVFPAFLFFDANGELIHRAHGFLPDTLMLKTAADALDPARQSEGMRLRYLQGERSPEFLYQYAQSAYRSNDRETESLALQYLKTQRDWHDPKNMRVIFEMVDEVQSNAFQFFLQHAAKFEELLGKAAVEEKILKAAVHELGMLIVEQEDDFEIDRDVEIIFRKYFSSPEPAKRYTDYYKMQFHANNGDLDAFFKLAYEYEDEYLWWRTRKGNPEQRARQYLEIARMVSENSNEKKHLRKAKRWAKHSVRLNPSYQNCYTLASYYYTLNEKPRAKYYMRKALKRAKKTNAIDQAFLAELESFSYRVRQMKKKPLLGGF